jgi:hypothetical protein
MKNQLIILFIFISKNIHQHYLIGNLGAHIYNGNMAQQQKKPRPRYVKKKKTLKKVEKEVEKKIVKKFRGTNRVQRGQGKGFAKKGIGKQFSLATQRLINNVVNPIHNRYPSKFTDPNNQPSFNFCDYLTFDDSTIISSADWGETPASCDRFLFYMIYGPRDLTLSEVSEFAWQIYACPIATGGAAIKCATDKVPGYESTNYEAITTLADQFRMVSMGFRINSKVDFNTSSDQQYVSKFIAGNLGLRDYEDWYENDGNIDEVIKGKSATETGNKQGASARFDPFQSPDLIKYFNISMLINTSQTAAAFNSEAMNYPYILVQFNDAIPFEVTPESVQVSQYIRKLNKMMTVNGKRVHAYPELQIEKSESFIELKEEEKTIQLQLVNGKYCVKKDKNVGVLYPGGYNLPVTLEARFWLEGILKLPSPLTSYPSPVDYRWNDISAFVSKSNFPVSSDGNSFHNIIGKFNPKNVRKAGKWAGGMLRAGRTGLSDLKSALR